MLEAATTGHLHSQSSKKWSELPILPMCHVGTYAAGIVLPCVQVSYKGFEDGSQCNIKTEATNKKKKRKAPELFYSYSHAKYLCLLLLEILNA